MIARIAPQIIASRLLVLQSKRLMLKCLERQLADTGRESLRQQIEDLRRQCDFCQHHYRRSVLLYGTPESMNYWVIAYSRLIEMGHTLALKLRDETGELPLAERYQVSADVEMLEEIVRSWNSSLREAMASAAVA